MDAEQPLSEPVTVTSVPRVLVRRNFWPYFAGNLLSQSGTWFQNVAQVLLVYRLTGSPLLVGVVNFSQFAAILVLAPVAGNAADRLDRRRLIIATQLCAAALAALLSVLTVWDLATPLVVIAVALALGVTTALSSPTLQALVPGLVSPSELHAAVSLNAVTFNLSRVLGPVAAVAVIANFGIATAFAINSLSYIALAGAMLLVTVRAEAEVADGRPRLRDSVRNVRNDSRLLIPLVVVGLVSLTADPVNTLTPVFATEIFGRPDTFTGILIGAFGAGAVVAAFVTGRGRPSLRSLAATLGLMGAGIAIFSLSGNAALGLSALFVAGFGYVASVTAATSLLHVAVEASHRGRMMSLWTLSFHGTRPVGSLVDGFVASVAGVRAAGLLMALPALAGCLGLAALVARRSR